MKRLLFYYNIYIYIGTIIKRDREARGERESEEYSIRPFNSDLL